MTGDALPIDQAETADDYGKGPSNEARRWISEYELGEKSQKKYRDRCKVITKRYRDERADDPNGANIDVGRRFNILWSNIETLKPATYAKPPKPQVERRWKDSDPMGRVASQVLERALAYSIDERTHQVLKACRDDYLLYARGVPWLRYVPHWRSQPPMKDAAGDVGLQVTNDEQQSAATEQVEGEQSPQKEVVFEEVIEDHVKYEDWGTNDARDWSEVYMVYRKTYLTRDEMVSRFGKEIGEAVPLDYTPSLMPKEDPNGALNRDMWKKATVVEIWNKPTREAIWINPGYSDGLLDKKPDPLGLKDFFPCPRPAFGTLTTGTMIPVPDYAQYQDQAQELDDLTARIARLVDVCRVMGLYDGTQTGIARLMQEGAENQLIPIDAWATFTKVGGIQGTVDWFPLEMVVAALAQLYASRKAVKDDLYEITGIADIVRGNSSPSETATAQQIKGQFATLRLRDKQEEMSRLARDMIAIKAEIISEKFRPETLALMSGVEINSDPQTKQMFQEAVALLRNDAMRNFRIDVETDSTIALDESASKQQAAEFLGVFGEMLTKVVEFTQVAAAAPVLAPLGDVIGQAMLFTMRQYKAGRGLESAMEGAIDKMKQIAAQPAPPPPPDPAAEKAKAETQVMQQKAAMDQQQGQQKLAFQQAEGQQKLQQTEAEGQIKIAMSQAELQQRQREAWIDQQMKLQAAATEAQARAMNPAAPNGRVN